ncbi:MAG: hypothetical protein JWM88_2878 [Verrucomicrobia bacterium]|nr:hypothetical protein [Verrucomicrobiota bacterium]
MKNANPVSRLLLGLVLLFLSGGCTAREPAAAPPKSVTDFFAVRVGDRTVRMQVAVLGPEMERGLMGRKDLGADDGMIFVYRAPQRLTFWMHDTPTALDIGFFNPDGTLAEVYPLLPFDERTVASRSDRLQFALEMNQNWYRDNGVRPGAGIDLAALKAALKARDFDPRKFGLDK